MKEQVTWLSLSLILLLPPQDSLYQTTPLSQMKHIARLVSSLILSMLDNCNSTLSGLPASSLLNRLRKLQNNAARLVFQQKSQWPCYSPVEARIHYKTATLGFRQFENSLPPDRSELLHTYQSSKLFGPAVKNCWKSSRKLTLNLPETDPSTFKQLK